MARRGLLVIVVLVACSMTSRAKTGKTAKINFIVQHSRSQKDTSLAAEARKVILPYLQKSGWEVVDKTSLDSDKQLPKEVIQLVGGGLEGGAKLAWINDTDFIVRFEINKKKKSGQMALEFAVTAFETVSGIKAAIATAISSSYPDEPGNRQTAIEDVCEQAMPGIQKQIENHLLSTSQQGAVYQILVTNPPQKAIFPLHQALRKKCRPRVKQEEETRLHFWARCKADRQAILELLATTFKSHFPKTTYRIVPTHKRFILVKVSP